MGLFGRRWPPDPTPWTAPETAAQIPGSLADLAMFAALYSISEGGARPSPRRRRRDLPPHPESLEDRAAVRRRVDLETHPGGTDDVPVRRLG